MYSIESSVDRLKRTRPRHQVYRGIASSVLLAVGIISVIILVLYNEYTLIVLGVALFFCFLLLKALSLLEKNYQAIFNTRLFCPNCRKHIPASDPWMCPICGNFHDIPTEIKARTKDDKLRIKAYSFIYKCSTCTSEATTYKCHECGEVLALTYNPDPERFVYNPLRLPGGVWVDEDLKSKVDKIKREEESEHQEIRDAERKFDVKDKLFDLEKKREEHYKRKVDDGLMSEEEAQKNLKKDRLYIERRRTLG